MARALSLRAQRSNCRGFRIASSRNALAMTQPMLYVLYAFLTGAASAFAFEPVGWWPLLPVAFALLCELL